MTLTQAARRESTSSRASFSASSEVQVLRITILSVLSRFRGPSEMQFRKIFRNDSGQQCYHYVPRPRVRMKAPLARLAFAIAILALGSYAVFAWRGPGGFRALSEKEARIKELERSNE